VNPSHGLSENTVARTREVLETFPEIESTVLFGSRAKGTYRPGSDIDLALTGSALDARIVGRVYDALDDLLLPYRFSLILFDHQTDPAVTAHIQRVGIPLYQRKSAARELLLREEPPAFGQDKG